MNQGNPYEDIQNLPYPFPDEDTLRHPRMSVADRAKIFAPFAALKGHQEAIRGKEKIVVPKMVLSEDAKEFLDQQLARMKEKLDQGEHPMVTVVYFQENGDHKKNDEEEEKGEYLKVTGILAKFNQDAKVLQIVERKIPLSVICNLTISE